MFLQELCDVMGLPIQEPGDGWPSDPVARLQEKAARITRALRQGYDALVRRRCRIEVLRQQIERAPKEAGWRLERMRLLLRGEESAYQSLLARVARSQRKLRRVQVRIYDVKTRANNLATLFKGSEKSRYRSQPEGNAFRCQPVAADVPMRVTGRISVAGSLEGVQ